MIDNKYAPGVFPDDTVLVYDDVWYNDTTGRKLVLIMQEPEVIHPIRNIVIHNESKFYKIYTCDQYILDALPDKAIKYVGNYATVIPDFSVPKQFKISGWASTKIYNDAPGHYLRLNVYRQQQKLPTCTFFRSNNRNQDGGPPIEEISNNPLLGSDFIGGKQCLFTGFQFSIVIENSRQQNYFTEKIIDCLITKTIPIYWGCPNINEFFDITGWLFFEDFETLKTAIATLNEEYYQTYIDTIDTNFEVAKQYSDFYENFNRQAKIVSS
jgi:Glycosyltransferase family 10 (fucosyltransferase) C-term